MDDDTDTMVHVIASPAVVTTLKFFLFLSRMIRIVALLLIRMSQLWGFVASLSPSSSCPDPCQKETSSIKN
jgi:hypothetical protein